MSDKKRTKEEIEKILCAERYPNVEAAIAAAQAMSEPGDLIQIHASSCAVDGPTDDGCTCEPIVVIHRGRTAEA